jgi:hypothetical protein
VIAVFRKCEKRASVIAEGRVDYTVEKWTVGGRTSPKPDEFGSIWYFGRSERALSERALERLVERFGGDGCVVERVVFAELILETVQSDACPPLRFNPESSSADEGTSMRWEKVLGEGGRPGMLFIPHLDVDDRGLVVDASIVISYIKTIGEIVRKFLDDAVPGNMVIVGGKDIRSTEYQLTPVSLLVYEEVKGLGSMKELVVCAPEDGTIPSGFDEKALERWRDEDEAAWEQERKSGRRVKVAPIVHAVYFVFTVTK